MSWAVWLGNRPWFSTGVRSRTARNPAADPRYVLTTDGAGNPVVLDLPVR
jgi:hypothetical protein